MIDYFGLDDSGASIAKVVFDGEYGLVSRGGRPDFHLRWGNMGAPQRPCSAVVEAMRPFLADRQGLALQLGVTPEIAHISRRGLAVDWNADMIRMAWPRNSDRHHAVLANWLALPLENACIDVAFGDGCMSMLAWPDQYRVFFGEMRRVLVTGGRLVMRCFADAHLKENVADVVSAALRGEIESFGAFKLRFNMAAFHSSDGADNSGKRIHDLFESYFPDRTRLSTATGWSRAQIDSIDAYAGAASVHSYPTRRQIAALLSGDANYGFFDTTDYPAADRCPLLVVDYPPR